MCTLLFDLPKQTNNDITNSGGENTLHNNFGHIEADNSSDQFWMQILCKNLIRELSGLYFPAAALMAAAQLTFLNLDLFLFVVIMMVLLVM